MFTGETSDKVLLEEIDFVHVCEWSVKDILTFIFSKKLRRKKDPMKV